MKLYILSALLFINGQLASLPFRITTVQTSLVTAMHAPHLFMEDQRMNADHTCKQFTSCDERTRVNTCLNKSLFQGFESSPVGGVTDGEIVCREYEKYVRRTSSLYDSKMSMYYHAGRCGSLIVHVYVSMRFPQDGLTQACSAAASMLAVNHKKKDCCSANCGTFSHNNSLFS